MPRAVTCVVLLASAAALRGQDAREIVRRAAEQHQRMAATSRDYTYLQRLETRDLDRSGQVQSRKIETWQILFLEGSPYRRLVARDDQAISPDEQKAEDEKLRGTAEERRTETAEQRTHRVAEYQRRQDRQREPVKEIADAFHFTLIGEQQYAGRTVYRIDGTPNPGFKPKSQLSSIFPKVKLQLWIDKRDGQAARVEMEVLDAISFGGFLVRLTKGSRLVVEQAPVADGVWMPKQFSLTAAARILLLKGLNRQLDYTFSNYKKSTVPAEVLAFAPKP